MKLRRLRSKTRRFLTRAQFKTSRETIILMYHRIVEPECDPWGLCVSPQNFAQQLEILRRSTCAARLGEIVHPGKKKMERRPVVALTFDDGYADNLIVGRPLLERNRVPATIFLTAGALGSDREFWWDELERIFLRTERLPEILELSIAGAYSRWELGDSANYQNDKQRAHHSWQAGTPPPTLRHKIYYSIWTLLRPLSYEEQRDVLNQLLLWADLDSSGRSSYRSLTGAEAVELSRSELVEIGAHTMTHPDLSSQPPAIQEDEIRQSKAELEKLVCQPVRQFAYPYGAYAPAALSAVRAAGFDLACSTHERTVPAEIEPYELPRFQVQNWSGEEFERRLARMLRSC